MFYFIMLFKEKHKALPIDENVGRQTDRRTDGKGWWKQESVFTFTPWMSPFIRKVCWGNVSCKTLGEKETRDFSFTELDRKWTFLFVLNVITAGSLQMEEHEKMHLLQEILEIKSLFHAVLCVVVHGFDSIIQIKTKLVFKMLLSNLSLSELRRTTAH